MKGIVRIDYIISKENRPQVIEINSIPGMSKKSIVPQMLEEDNITLKEIL